LPRGGVYWRLRSFPTRRSSDLVEEPAHEERVGEQQPHVRERGRLREPERVRVGVEQVGVPLERGDEHDVEGQRREQREERHGQRSEEHTSELQSRENLRCSLLL